MPLAILDHLGSLGPRPTVRPAFYLFGHMLWLWKTAYRVRKNYSMLPTLTPLPNREPRLLTHPSLKILGLKGGSSIVSCFSKVGGDAPFVVRKASPIGTGDKRSNLIGLDILPQKARAAPKKTGARRVLLAPV